MVVIGIASVETCWVWAGPLRCRAAHLLGRRPPASPKALLNGRESARRRLLRPRAWLSACTSYRIVSTQKAAVTAKRHRIMNLSAAEADRRRPQGRRRTRSGHARYRPQTRSETAPSPRPRLDVAPPAPGRVSADGPARFWQQPAVTPVIERVWLGTESFADLGQPNRLMLGVLVRHRTARAGRRPGATERVGARHAGTNSLSQVGTSSGWISQTRRRCSRESPEGRLQPTRGSHTSSVATCASSAES